MMIFRSSHRLMDEAPGAGGAAAPAVVAPVVSAAPPAPTPAPPTAPAAAPAVDSLLKPPPTGTPTAPAAAPGAQPSGDAPAWAAKVPEKFHVKGTDGKIDTEATLLKQSESYTNLEKSRLPAAPSAATDYTFQVPESFKDLAPAEPVSMEFKERMHKLGLSQEQYAGVMQEYFDLVPGVLDSALKLTADQARAELSKVWQSPAEFEAGLSDAQRAVDGAPAAVRQDLWARFGRDPVFLQFAASLGKEMREDRSPANPDGGAPASNEVETLMASKAYRDPKDPQHQAVTQRVQAHFKRVHGSAAAVM